MLGRDDDIALLRGAPRTGFASRVVPIAASWRSSTQRPAAEHDADDAESALSEVIVTAGVERGSRRAARQPLRQTAGLHDEAGGFDDTKITF